MRLEEAPLVLVDVIILSASIVGLVVLLLCLPRRNRFFLRWYPETRFLALLAAPSLLILWPLVLIIWLMRAGILPDELDFYDD